MTFRDYFKLGIIYTLVFVVGVLILTGCAGTPPPEPVIITKEVQVAVPVQCKALEQLGPEPAYPDTDEAIKAAPSLFERTKLILKGRIMRIQRLAEYQVVKVTC